MLRDGLRLKPVPVFQDCNGIDPDALEEAIKANLSTRSNWKPTASKPYWAMLYLIPQFHNPTGVCLSSERSQRIIQIARRYNLLVICDDVYNLLYFPSHYSSGCPPQRLFAYDKKDDSDYAGNVISNGSFSKIFAPGVRCGWMEVPQVVKSIFKYSLLFESGGAINHAMCGLLTNLMEQDKLTRPIEEARLIHEERCKAVVDVFHTRLPFIELQPPTGGYFIWFKLPHNINNNEFIEKCLNEKKIALFSGKVFNVDPDNTENDHFIRMTFSYYDKDELVKAAHLIADAMIELQQQV
jgi:DNA-binding transcriptional MocR family regulator